MSLALLISVDLWVCLKDVTIWNSGIWFFEEEATCLPLLWFWARFFGAFFFFCYLQKRWSFGWILGLENVQVGSIKDSKPYEVAINAGLRVVPFESLKRGVEALDQGQIKSFVVDFSVIESYMSENAIVNLDVSDFNLRWDLYSFATKNQHYNALV